jgi:hypothetical protein
MEEGTDKYNRMDRSDREEIFSKVMRAGKRTYFFDVRATSHGDYYLTITESKKRIDDNGKFSFEKHKIFLYKEDFNKFMEGLNESIDHIKANSTEEIVERVQRTPEERAAWAAANAAETTTPAPSAETKDTSGSKSFSDVNFEDLDK